MIAKNMTISATLKGYPIVSIELTDKTATKALEDLTECDLLDVTIKKHRKKRTLTQNSYLWTLCNEIAIKLDTTKEQIYRLAIRHVGVFELIPIKNSAVELFRRSWSINGEGWICEELRESKIEGYTTLQCYYGSSVYDTKQQARLIDYIVTEAKELGIDTMSPDEVERLTR